MELEKYYKKTSLFISALLILFSIGMIYPMGFSIMEGLSVYSLQIIFLFILLAMMFLIIDAKRLMFSSLLGAAILCLFLKNNSNSNLVMPEVNTEAHISVAHFNLSSLEPDVRKLSAILNDTNSDVLSFQEYTPVWKEILDSVVVDSHPYGIDIMRIDPFGLSVYSKEPFDHIDTSYVSGIPIICFGVPAGHETIELVSTYVSPPLDAYSEGIAEKQLSAMNTILSASNFPHMVVGEFNDVYWSNRVRTFRNDNNLVNSRRNTTVTNLDIPLDHIFHSESLECIEFSEVLDMEDRKVGILGNYQIINP